MRKITGMHLAVIVDGEVPNIRVTKLDGDISNTPQTVARGVATVLVGSKTEEAVDTGKGIVHLNDSGSKDGRDEQIPMAMFVKAWATSHNFMSVTQETRN